MMHTNNTPCVCVQYLGGGAPDATTGETQTARRRRVCRFIHAVARAVRSFVLFCLGAKLHTQHTPSVCKVCVREGVA